MVNIKIIIGLIIIALIAVPVYAYTVNDSIVGTWQFTDNDSYTMIFKSNGNFQVYSPPTYITGTWKKLDDKTYQLKATGMPENTPNNILDNFILEGNTIYYNDSPSLKFNKI